MNTATKPMQAIEYAIDEAKPVFWIQNIRIEGSEAVIDVEMSYLGVKTDLEIKKSVMDVFTYDTYISEEYSDMEYEGYKFLNKMAESFQKEVSNPLSYQFKNLVEKWNK